MSTFELICITNRTLCTCDLTNRILSLSSAGIDKIILREKDLSAKEYSRLARQLAPIAKEKLILHSFAGACEELNIPRLHVSLATLAQQPDLRERVSLLGASIHSPDEAKAAQDLGADYVIAGHVFETSCKPDLPGRGLEFLSKTCGAVRIPVYAIGGISESNIAAVRDTGASGACIMSGLMQCESPKQTLDALRRALYYQA